MNFHNISITNAFNKLQTTENGLTQNEAEKRLKKYGINEIPSTKPLNKLNIFFSQFNNALVYVLLFAGSLSYLLKAYVDSGVIFGAVILNVIIGFIQENKANQAIAKLKNLVEHKAFVVRDKQEILVDSKLLVVGDIIWIKTGNRVPSDARIIDSSDLSVNESSLTGESIASNKKIDKLQEGTVLADRNNMVYAGTLVVRGSGRAVVTAIGKNTEVGKIAEMVRGAKEKKTPLQERLEKFSRTLGLIFALVCSLVTIIGLIQGRDFLEIIETGVALGVASIPEGLTVAVTFILALGMQQILKKRALVRKLVAAETLGSTTVICTDKTGTLTEGKMHVAHIIIGDNELEIKDTCVKQENKEAGIINMAMEIALMCNNAFIENPKEELGRWNIIGTPTETALFSAAIQAGLNKEKLLNNLSLVDEIPFDSERKYMACLHKRNLPSANGSYILYEKGAPEKLLEKSVKYYQDGFVHLITDERKAKLKKTYETLTSRGLRVIGLAIRDFSSKNNYEKNNVNWENVDKDLTFVAFVALKDPLRKDAKETINLCKQAGIRPIIITGDHKLTAKAIAQEVGMCVKAENIIIGEKLDNIDDEKLKKLVKKIDVYARVNPHHKLRIVKALQDCGEVVAMTGDGINDSPALKAADIGISLGTGTDIAKETSDIVLLDDNFKTIVSTVRQGRVIFKNIRNVITYLLSDCFSEIILITGSILLNMPLAILPAQILWINIVNDSLPHFSLAFEKGDDSIMREKPISKNHKLLSREMKYIIFVAGIIRDMFIFGTFFCLLFLTSFDTTYIRTIIFAIVGISSLMHIFSLRNLHKPIWQTNFFSNKYLLAAVFVSFLGMLLGIYWGPFQSILITEALSPVVWLIILGNGLISIILIEIVKYFFTANSIQKVPAK